MTNIFAQFAQPVRSIADYQAEDDNRALRREQLAGAQRNNALADLTAQQTRQTMEDQQRSNALIQAAYRSAQPGEGDDALIGRLQLGGDRGSLEYAQKLQEQRGKKAEIDAKTREAQAKALAEVASTVKRFATGVMANPTPQVAMQAIDDMEAMHKQFGLPGNFDAQRKQIAEMTGPDQIRQWAAGHMGSADLVTKKLQLVSNGKVQTPVDMNPITNPAGPAPITMTTTPGEDLTATTSTDNNKRTVGATLAGQRSVAETARLARAQAESHFNTTRNDGKWTYDSERGGQVNTQTGEFRPAVQGGVPIGPKDKQPSEGERNAAGFAARMTEATPLLDKLEKTGRPGYTSAIAGGTPFIGGAMRTAVMTQDQQQYRQAQEDWVRAKLRKESGASIATDEMDKEIATYFPQPGESSPQVIAQKQRARAIATEGMNKAAGRAAYTSAVPPATAAIKPGATIKFNAQGEMVP